MRRALLFILLALLAVSVAQAAEPSRFTLPQSGGTAADPLTVLGPSSVCADNQIARWDGASATQLQCSVVTIDDTTGSIVVPGAGSVTAQTGGFFSNSGGFNVAGITRLSGDSLSFRTSGFIGWGDGNAECASTACDSGLKRYAAGEVVSTDGGSGVGSFRTLRLTVTGALVAPPVVKTTSGAYNVTATDYIVIVNKASGQATTVNLPGSPATGRVIVVKDGKGDAASNNITITPAAGTIDGGASVVITSNYGSVAVVYNGTEWSVI